MKNYCIIPMLLFLLLMLAYQCSKAQDYVVTIKGDTIRGEVKPLLFIAGEQRVQITSTGEKKKVTYAITQTRGFSYDGEIFHPVRTSKGYAYMKLVKAGYLSLYAFQMENQTSFDGQFLIKKDGTSTEVPNLSFKKALTKFLVDCQIVSSKIEKGEYSKREVGRLVEEYNQCISGRTIVTKTAAPAVIQPVVVQPEPAKTTPTWDILEEKLTAQPEFEGKKDALDMIAEIKNKLARAEKIPNFMLEGLKTSLSNQAGLQADLENALKEITK